MKKKTPEFGSEVDLALAVAGWAESFGWEVYKEVHTPDGDIDLVLKQGSVLWAIETKLRLNCDVLEQAYRRLLHTHYVSVAVPSRKGDLSFVYSHFLDDYGIGLIEADNPDNWRIRSRSVPLSGGRIGHVTEQSPTYDIRWEYVCREEVKPKIWRPHDLSKRVKQNHFRVKKIKAIKEFLCEKHKTLIAGAPGGGQWTPFKATTENVKVFLKEVGQATIKEIVEKVKHHYKKPSAARSGIYRLMDEIDRKSFERVLVGKETFWRLKDVV